MQWNSCIISGSLFTGCLSFYVIHLDISTIGLVAKREYEGQGIGTALVRFAEEWSLVRDSKMLYLTSGIKPERMRTHEFYKANGFEVTGYRFVKKRSILQTQ